MECYDKERGKNVGIKYCINQMQAGNQMYKWLQR